MAFPQSIDPSSPLDTDSPSLGAAQFRNLKQFLVDVFGLSAAPFVYTTSNTNVLGACRISLSGGNITIAPYNGNRLSFPSGVAAIVPASGTVTLGTGGLAASTTYGIYAVQTAGTVTSMEASVTGHSADAATGIQIKTGDATRVLVGAARTTAGTAWADSLTQRFVISYFNRRTIGLVNNFTAIRSTASGTYVELNSEIRCEFVTWGDEGVNVGVQGVVTNGTAAAGSVTAVGFDGTNQENAISEMANPVGIVGLAAGIGISFVKNGLSEGYHFATVLGNTSGGSTGNWFGGTFVSDTTQRAITSLAIGIRG